MITAAQYAKWVNRMGRMALTAVTALVVSALAACSSSGNSSNSTSPSASPSPTVTSSASASPTNPYGTPPAVDPPGPTEPVLVVSGGSAGPQSFTLAQLEALGTTTITIDEPFIKKRQSFTGVPMAAVLATAGIPATATIYTKALNDYEYAAPASNFIGSQALIATQRDGQPVPFDAGGPIRIVFPDGSPLSSVLDAWNWSLSSIAVVTASPSPTTS